MCSSDLTGMTCYPEALRTFLNEGRILALGLVPTSPKILEETVESLAAALADRLGTLAARTGLKTGEIAARCLLTPSCGAGSLPPDLADRILETVSALSRRVRGPGGPKGGA